MFHVACTGASKIDKMKAFKCSRASHVKFIHPLWMRGLGHDETGWQMERGNRWLKNARNFHSHEAATGDHLGASPFPDRFKCPK